MFGGYTKHEYDLIQASQDAWRNRCVAAETSVSLFNEIMARERERNKKLEDKMMGWDQEAKEVQQPPQMNPVGQNKVSSWPRIRRELERLHRVKDNAPVSREEIEKNIREG